jgi:hypothetical protein
MCPANLTAHDSQSRARTPPRASPHGTKGHGDEFRGRQCTCVLCHHEQSAKSSLRPLQKNEAFTRSKTLITTTVGHAVQKAHARRPPAGIGSDDAQKTVSLHAWNCIVNARIRSRRATTPRHTHRRIGRKDGVVPKEQSARRVLLFEELLRRLATRIRLPGPAPLCHSTTQTCNTPSRLTIAHAIAQTQRLVAPPARGQSAQRLRYPSPPPLLQKIM